MLLAASDDQGRGIAEADVITWEVCPNVPELTIENIPDLLREIEAQGMIYLYVNGEGNSLYQIVNWWKYQKLQWAKPSKYAAPDGWMDRVRMYVRNSGYTVSGWDTTGGFNAEQVVKPEPKEAETDDPDEYPPDDYDEIPPGNLPGNPPGSPKEKKINQNKPKEKERKDRSADAEPPRPPPGLPDPHELTVAEIKRLTLSIEEWRVVQDLEKRGKHRSSALSFIRSQINPMHPAVKAYQSITHTLPIDAMREKIAREIGDKPEDIELWKKVIIGYAGQGWNIYNIANMIVFYERGEIPASRNQAKKKQRPPGSAADEWLRQRQEAGIG